MRLLFGLMLLGVMALVGGWSYQVYDASRQAVPLELLTSHVFENPRDITDFELQDQDGNAFGPAQLQGQWSLVFLGYTSCPDVCPTTMAKLAAAYDDLKRIAPLQIVFLSVDPSRDSLNKLKDYRNFFHPEIVAVTGEHQQLYPLTQALGMVYAMVGSGDDYLVDHSASLVLLNPQGQRYAVFKPQPSINGLGQMTRQQLISDFATLTHH
ncbi:SCO family protein [Shewanella sp. NIFS-20-20]|uniref:SCO family protein n=1 Tax=Shewanella sp. NIFS-20-20 TaxID=2853806 RepID=UPI001C446C0A|nr:SCO family protein [Shewanella sp. NIFS-20-20]MBV7316938.1 SCO family protein [Shewanella sp. NIFS-20-20]